jgi:hypothetical protein
LNADLLNNFLADVAAVQSSPALGLNARAAAVWMADLNNLERPVNRLTLRLIHSITANYRTGNKLLLSVPDLNKLTSQKPSPAYDLVALMATTGLRIFELHRLQPSNVLLNGSLLKTNNAKGFPNGRSVFTSPLARKFIDSLTRQCACLWYLHPHGKDELLAALKCVLAMDPVKLPNVSLRCLRTLYATRLFQLGVSSAFIQRQLNHYWWETSCIYIKLPNGSLPAWRAKCEAPVGHEFVPEAAFQPEFVHDDPKAYSNWRSKWRKSMHFSYDIDIDDDDASDPDVGDK